ncbi:MAG: hydroxymethylglutaryl-CoA lyase [Chitinophagaceae bacterium]
MSKHIKLIECPRDAMQGWKTFIPTETKINYLNQLLQVGFDTLDFGSFVSAKAIPQLADTAEVLKGLHMTSTKLLAIIANLRGAETAVQFDEIHYLGFPFSISETFQQKNTNSSIAESLKTVEAIQTLCEKHKKRLVIYISMGFGNPYGDPYNSDIALQWVEQLNALGIGIFAMSDTVGVANPTSITPIFEHLVREFPLLDIGAHLHATPETAEPNIHAAYQAGCRRFDVAIGGIGGCPMAQNDLVGNLATEQLVRYFDQHEIPLTLNRDAFNEACRMAAQIFI